MKSLIKNSVLLMTFSMFICGAEPESKEIVKHLKPSTNDFTHILNKNDFEMLQEDCKEPEDRPYFIEGTLACPVWQCFPVSYFKLKCDDNIGDEEMPTALIIEISD